AGPAYNAGRYGVACGALGKAVAERFSVPSVTGMYRENPGVDLYREHTLVLETGENARTMVQDLERMLLLGRRLQAGQPIRRPREEGYFSRGILAAELSERSAATRAV